MAQKRQKKIVKFPNRLQRIFQDSGLILFTIIAVYMIICLVQYWSKPHISIYEVKHGSISKDYSYNGLILRTEQLIPADRSGYVTYYAREGEKVGSKTTVCAVDETGQLTQMIEEATADHALLTADDILTFKEDVQAYQSAYDKMDFKKLYSFKQNLESSMMELVHLKLLDTAAQSVGESSLVNIYKSAYDGVLSYSVDGMENLTLESITKDTLNQDRYKSTDLKKQSIVNPSEPMYKLITEEDWSVVIELDKALADLLTEEEYVEITFLKDNQTAWGQVSSWDADGTTFVMFSFTNSMVRYASERYLDIRFQLDDVDGLKVPVSAVLEESFYTIPAEYITKGGNNDQDGVIIETHETDGSVSQKFQVLNPVKTKDELVYVSMDDFHSGDTLIKPESTERYDIGKTADLKGVYNMDKGYAVFCPVTIICENSEYYIIDGSKSTGLSQYDRIVLEAKTAKENKLLD